jgi:hypothetical protein
MLLAFLLTFRTDSMRFWSGGTIRDLGNLGSGFSVAFGIDNKEQTVGFANYATSGFVGCLVAGAAVHQNNLGVNNRKI